MSNPQLENGYTRIANEIMEALAVTDLNGTQRRILDVILRQTYGYQRKEHELSLTFISNATKIHKMQVQRELATLIERKIVVTMSEASFNKSRILSFNKNYKEWSNSEQLAKKLTGSESANHTVSGLANTTVSGLANQIKKKENIKEIVMTPYESEFISVLENIKDYPLDRNKDLEYMKVLEERYPTLDLVEAVKKFSIWVLDNPFKKNSNHRSQINTSFGKYVEWGACIKQEEPIKRGPLKLVIRDNY